MHPLVEGIEGGWRPEPSRRGFDSVLSQLPWVFLVGERAFKLKKPVRFAYLDFLTRAAREANCRAELTLNAEP